MARTNHVADLWEESRSWHRGAENPARYFDNAKSVGIVKAHFWKALDKIFSTAASRALALSPLSRRPGRIRPSHPCAKSPDSGN